MGKVYEGNLEATGKKFAIIVSRFNELVTQRLLDGAQDRLVRYGVKKEHIDVVWVPGSFEIPLIAQRLTRSKKYDAIICLGAIIKGDTPHFDYIASESAKGIAHVCLESGIPIEFGIITAETVEQAMERAGIKRGNKGAQAAESAVEMVNILKQI
ncbi:MAG: 6,7-dimethyl-8-ribityllumazine synthase [Planctomycetota bacterium]|nr:6,7-dimethyl-8-ribityllumazine synthase [Planctomycetota bacterium]MDI6788539.1 6,7-dimethyl-8-ribityllumazine synthase [Planctomycetota bacterium]